MIFVIASIGTERIAPGAPHIQNQKTSEMSPCKTGDSGSGECVSEVRLG
jgi:hypothetical protein